MQHPEMQIPMSQPHPTPTLQTRIPNVTAQKTAHLTKRCACAVKSSSTLQHLTFPHVSSLFHTNLTLHVSSQTFPQLQRLNGCGRLRTVDNSCERYDNESRTRPYPQTPRVKREPFTMHSGNETQLEVPTLPLVCWSLVLVCRDHLSTSARSPTLWVEDRFEELTIGSSHIRVCN